MTVRRGRGDYVALAIVFALGAMTVFLALGWLAGRQAGC